MAYVFTQSGGSLKIVNAATNFEASTSNPVNITSGLDPVNQNPFIKITNDELSILMDLIEISTIGGAAAAGTIDGVINQILALTPSSSSTNLLPGGAVAIADGITNTLKATVAQFHNADNQALPNTANGLLGGGVAQLVNSVGNLDRQRETGADNITAVGISTGTQQLKSPIATTLNGAIVANVNTMTLAGTKFTNGGSPAWIGNGSILVLEPGTANQETVIVLTVNYGTNVVTVYGAGTGANLGKTLFAHANGVSITSGAYNEARDATIADGAGGVGISPSAALLWNAILNAGNGGWEKERSAAGELDGATGAGTAVAAEYEWNGGAPGNGNYDRARNLQAKLKNTGLVAGGSGVAAGVSTLTLSAVTGLNAGEQVIIDRGTANQEVLYVAATYVAGTLTVGFTSNTQFTHANGATVEWDDFAANGPGLNGFLATGVGIEEECVYDPVSNLNYVERSATQDTMPSVNIVAECEALFNAFGNNGFERARSVLGKALFTGALTAVPGAAGAITLTFTADPSTATVGALKAGMQILLAVPGPPMTTPEIVTVLGTYTGGVSVPISATQIAHGAGTTAQWEGFAAQGPGLNGFLGTGMDIDEDCVFDPISGLYYIERSATADGMAPQNIVAENNTVFNGATFDRLRGNVDTAALVTLTAAAAGGNSADQVNYNGRGLQLLINVTAITGTSPTLTVTIQGKDAASGVYYTLLASAAITAVGTYLLTIYPGGLNTANVASPTVLPRTWRVLYAIGGTTPAVTATIGASVIV